jgi:outer membrane lipoprotein-sorting protein
MALNSITRWSALRRIIPLALSLLLVSLAAGAQEILTADRFLESVGKKYAEIKDYQAKVSIVSGKADMKGVLIHKAPALLRIDFSVPEEQVIVFNGDSLTVYLPEYRAVLSQDVQSGGSSSSANLASARGLSIMRRNYVAGFAVGPAPVPLSEGSSELVVKLSLSRRSLSEGFRELTVSVVPDTLLIRRIEGKTIADETVIIEFSDIILDQGIPEARFVYDSPASANLYNNFLFKDTN